MEEHAPVWLVTGASKGIGLEIARAALAAGARVAATSRDPGRLAAQLGSGADGDRFLGLAMSLTDPADIDRAVATVQDRFGGIDVLVNNAGYSLLGAVEEFSPEEVRANFDVNVFGLLAVTRAVLPGMRARGAGRILNLASISATVTGPATGLYSASKAAVLMLTEALAAEIAPLGLHATAICPGGVRTDFLDPSSSRRAADRIDEYRTVTATLDQLDRLNHRQGGDPVLLARALLEVAALPDPPSRLYLGEDALAAVVDQTEHVLESIEEHQRLSRSISSRRG